jgi:hypothetical protein
LNKNGTVVDCSIYGVEGRFIQSLVRKNEGKIVLPTEFSVYCNTLRFIVHFNNILLSNIVRHFPFPIGFLTKFLPYNA